MRGSVEKRLGAVALVAMILGATAPGSSAAPSAGGEPNPSPQVGEAGRESDYGEARRLIDQRKWAEAAIVLRSVLRRSPDFTLASLQLSMALAQSGRREEALTLLHGLAGRERGVRKDRMVRRSRALSRVFMTNANFQLYQDGYNLMLNEKYRSAREKFERALEAEPDNVEILIRLGQCLLLDGDHDSAAERLRIARRLNPYEPQARLWLGRALFQRGEVLEGIEELKGAAAELKGSELAPVWLAEAMFYANQKQAAMDLLEKDLREQPYHLMALLTLARLQTQFSSRGTDMFWAARKNLQVALSRLEKYASPALPPFETDLGINLRKPPEELRTEVQKVFLVVDSRLERTEPRSTSGD
jgi:tetratricopeptide (TPR) repeat protein